MALVRSRLGSKYSSQKSDGLSCESSFEEPADYGEVAAFVVGGEDYGVFLF